MPGSSSSPRSGPLEILKSELGRPYLWRLECVDPHDCLVEGPETLRARVRALRLSSA
jgi:hypothetical protein